jgi:hypothetical protein
MGPLSMHLIFVSLVMRKQNIEHKIVGLYMMCQPGTNLKIIFLWYMMLYSL